MEATAIAFALQGIVTARPMTHDLMRNLLEELTVRVERIVITELKDGTFYAVIQLQQDGNRFEVSSRPSDAIALAVRAKVPVLVEDRVFDKAGPGASGPRTGRRSSPLQCPRTARRSRRLSARGWARSPGPAPCPPA